MIQWTNLYLVNNSVYVPAMDMNKALSIYQEKYPDECILKCVKIAPETSEYYYRGENIHNTLIKIDQSMENNKEVLIKTPNITALK